MRTMALELDGLGWRVGAAPPFSSLELGNGSNVSLLAMAVVAAVLLLCGVLFGWALSRWVRGRRASARSRRGLSREAAAERLLTQAGYEVLAAQVRQPWSVFADGREISITLRADYVVCKSGRRYVADAKSGDWATSLRNAGTRRQLLEYLLAYEASGALLVDTDEARVIDVRFGRP